MDTPRPSPYSVTDTQETLAIDIFKSLTDHEKVKSDLKERDKYPNIDGYVELVDDLRIAIAKLEVQVKKLPDKEPKMPCPISLISYSERAGYPVLFVGVDTIQRKAYWVHVNNDLIGKPISECKQNSVTISFPIQNVLDGVDSKYINEWQKLAERYQTKIQKYDDVKYQLEKLEKLPNPILGVEKADFESIHLFLSELNMLLDKDFLSVKNIFYPKTWKLGVAYSTFEDNKVSFTIYPIPFFKNDVQIKEIETNLHDELKKEGLGWWEYYVEKPIKMRPREFAIDFIESDMVKIIKNRLLDYTDDFLAKEFVFAFVDKFLKQMGLEKKDTYSIKELETAFYQYLFFWVSESIKFIVKIQRNRVKSPIQLTYRKSYFDPGTILYQIIGKERETIDKAVRERIRRKDPVPRIPLGNEKMPFGLFRDFINFLKSNSYDEIKRLYSPKDYSRLSGSSRLVWNLLSPAALEENLTIFLRICHKLTIQFYQLIFQK